MIEQANQQIERCDILKQVGDDPERAALETPQRVAKMYGEVLAYQGETILKTTSYSLKINDDQMVMMGHSVLSIIGTTCCPFWSGQWPICR